MRLAPRDALRRAVPRQYLFLNLEVLLPPNLSHSWKTVPKDDTQIETIFEVEKILSTSFFASSGEEAFTLPLSLKVQ